MQVFSKEWFTKHQRKLLWFANTWFGRYVFRIHGDRSSIRKNKIVKIDPNSITWIEKRSRRKVYCSTEFRTHDKFAKRLYYAFKPIWHVMHFFDWIVLDRLELAKRFSFGFDTLTAYPAAGAVSPCDGYVKRDSAAAGENFATIRAGAGTTFSVAGVNANATYLWVDNITSGNFNSLFRGFWLFDTSGLTASATISATVLSLFGENKSNGLGDDSIEIVSATPAATDTLENADYSQVGTTSFSSIAYADFSATAYNDFTLSAGGRANVSKTGISKFATRGGWDLSGTFGGIWGNGLTSRFLVTVSSDAGASPDPKLVVTYTLPTSGAGVMVGITF